MLHPDPLGNCIHTHTQVGQTSPNRVEIATPLLPVLAVAADGTQHMECHVPRAPSLEQAAAPWRAEGPQDRALTQSTARRDLPERDEMGAVGT